MVCSTVDEIVGGRVLKLCHFQSAGTLSSTLFASFLTVGNLCDYLGNGWSQSNVEIGGTFDHVSYCYFLMICYMWTKKHAGSRQERAGKHETT